MKKFILISIICVFVTSCNKEIDLSGEWKYVNSTFKLSKVSNTDYVMEYHEECHIPACVCEKFTFNNKDNMLYCNSKMVDNLTPINALTGFKVNIERNELIDTTNNDIIFERQLKFNN